MKKIKHILPFLIILISTFSFAQRTITGVVTDKETNEPLIGAPVFVKATKIGTVTDINGFYTLEIPNGSDSLVIEFIGYFNTVSPISNYDVINVQLESDLKQWEMVSMNNCFTPREIYSKNRTLIPYEYIPSKSFNKGNIHDPLQLLRGKVAGVEITRGGNDPNMPFTARIRGMNTYSGENRPTMMIDGVPYTSLNLLDPMDIGGIEAIKDGAQCGMRGLQGVLNFETKKDYFDGFSFNTSVTTEGLIRPMQVMTRTEFIIKGGKDYDSNTDWRSLLTQKAVTQVHNLAWSKHFKNTDFRISSNYRNAEGVLKESGFEQFNGRFNIQQRLFNDKIRLTANAAYTSRNSELTNGYIYQQAHSFNPTAPVYDSKNTANGGYFEQIGYDNYNPLSILEQSWYRGKNKAYSGNLKAEWQITPDLKALTTISHENQEALTGHYYAKTAAYIGRWNNGEGYRTNDETQNNYLNSSINYEKNINSWHLKSQVGYEYQKLKIRGKELNARNYDKDVSTFEDLSLGKFGISDSLPSSEKTTFNDHTLIGFYGRAEMDYDRIYFLSLGFRHDGSSRLGINKKWVSQPSISAGVDFTQLFNLSTFNLLKGRLGYSTTSAAPFQSNLTQRTYFLNDKSEPLINQLENPNLAPEMKREWNAGLDFNIMGGRFYGSLDVYKNKVSDIISQNYNTIVGFSFNRIWANTATLQNKGIELTLRGTPISRNFTWETGLTLAHNESRFLSFKREGEFNYSFVGWGGGRTLPFRTGVFTWGCPEGVIYFKEGEKIGNFIGPHFMSIDNNGQAIMQEEADTKYGGFKNEGIVGNAMPQLTMAWSNNFQYKNFDLNFVLRSAMGFDILNEYRGYHENYSSFFNQVITKYSIAGYKSFIPFSDRTLEKGNFVKLDNISIGYVLNNIKFIKQLRVYVSADNLLILTKYSGSDPEPHYNYINYSNNYNPPSNYLTGVDSRQTYPLSKSFTFGVNMRF
jgi:TonB-dependent starch-binding outer membrane protein SusC